MDFLAEDKRRGGASNFILMSDCKDKYFLFGIMCTDELCTIKQECVLREKMGLILISC